MREQIEERVASLRVTLEERERTVLRCEAAVIDALQNRDRVAGGICELEYALEVEPILGLAEDPRPAGDGKPSKPTNRLAGKQ